MGAQIETISVRLGSETRAKLEQLAKHVQRTESSLVGEAVSKYVERELAIVSGIFRGIEDMKAGRTIPHEEAMARIQATIDRVAAEKRK